MRTRGELEAELSKVIVRFEKEHLGRGPIEARCYLIDDMVLFRLKNVLIPSELKLAQTADTHRGRDLIKQMRQELIEQGRSILQQAVENVLGIAVISLHTDISTITGERIIVLTLAEPPPTGP
jgi:uncharacterized protein YbcI